MKLLHGIRTFVFCAGTAFCLLVSFQASPAQTDYSLRTYALSIHLAGIVEDALTDLYLNPARAGLIDRPEVYGVNLPVRSIVIPFPISDRYLQSQLTPIENYTSSYKYHPIAFNFLHTYKNRFHTAIGLETAVSNDDEIDSDNGIYMDSDYVLRDFSRYSIGKRQVDHAALSIACAVPFGTGYAGARFEAEYDSEQYRSLYDTVEFRLRTDGGNNSYLYQNYEVYSRHYEMTSFAISAGLYRPRCLISDAVIGCGLARSLYPAVISESRYENEDYDGNGIGMYGGMPDNLYRETAYDSHRDYRWLSFFGKVHLQLTESLRTAHLLSWTSAHGDGAASFRNIDDELDTRDLFDHRLGYAYDGDFSSLYVSSAIGYAGEIDDGVFVFLGAKGSLILRSFKEDSPGSYATLILNNDFPDTFSVSGTYAQNHDNDEAYYYFIVPASLEWKLGTHIQLRMGVDFTAAYDDVEHYYKQIMPVERAPATFDEQRGLINYDLVYKTGALFHNGLAINIRDTFIVDLYYYYDYSSTLSAASFNHISVRYRF
ncbi:MAG: hypothetical protein HY770_00740 [Chitinivibrionia bacterium]|nr:hypothetical protein [Chitinivibrionia bacterium]